MNFDQFALVVVKLLPEAQGGFRGVHFLELAGTPVQTAGNVQPVAPSATWQFVPGAELVLVLGSSAHWGLVARSRVASRLRREVQPGSTGG